MAHARHHKKVKHQKEKPKLLMHLHRRRKVQQQQVRQSRP